MSGFTGFVSAGRSSTGLRARVASGVAFVVRMAEVALSRRYLLEMDDRMLHDLGISRAQANFEASRAPWHVEPTR